MSIVRDEGDERQARLDRMIDEFRTAQSRRRQARTATVVADTAVDPQREASAGAAVALSVPPATAH